MPIKIVVTVEGGVVTSVYCSSANAEVKVIDHDTDGDDSGREEANASAVEKLDQEIAAKTMHEVY